MYFQESTQELEANKVFSTSFKPGDIVKIKEEFLEPHEDDNFHVVQNVGQGYSYLTEICEYNIKNPTFAPSVRTGTKYIDTYIYDYAAKK